MKCNYPNCNQTATHVPVVAIPTIRTVGLIPPTLSELVHDSAIMQRMQLDMGMTIRLYEAQLAEYKAHATDMVVCPEPTLIIGQEICIAHARTYKFLDWFGQPEWDHMCEAACNHGVLLDIADVKVKWAPVEWEPGEKYIAVQR
jgi:hypothetical protein